MDEQLSRRFSAPKIVCAVDLGGTNLRAAVVDDQGKIHFRVKRPTPTNAPSAEEVLDAIVATIGDCQQASEHIMATAVVVPGTVDVQNEVVLRAPNLACLDGFPMAARLRDQFSNRVLLENDANAAAVGEMWQGAARGFQTICCLTLGTGVGGGIILDGKLWRGAGGSAGEIGHTPVEAFSKLKCNCGSTGCLEQFISAQAVVRMAREGLALHPESLLQGKDITAAEVYEAGTRGDQLAIEIFKSVGTYLGVGITILLNVINPEMIVIGGGLANAWKLFEDNLKREVESRATAALLPPIKIVPALCGDDAGLLGAARLALD